MLKILHTADVHLGAKFKYLGDKAKEQRERIKKAFSNTISEAVSQKADVVLISGDLFDSNIVSTAVVEFVKSQFRILEENSIKVCVIGGTHDCLDKEKSIYLRENIAKDFGNIFVFLDNGADHVEYPELDLTIWGKSNLYPKSTESPIIKLGSTNTAYNVLMAHGSVQIEGKAAKDDYPIQFSDIKDCGMDYVALGHWHSTGDYSQGATKCYYSGSPEIIDIDQKGAGDALMVEIAGKEDVSVRSVKVGMTSILKTEVDIGAVEDKENINDFLRQEILKGADPNMIRIVELKGLAPADLIINIEELESELSDNFLRLKIISNFHLTLDLVDEKDYPEELVIGQFVRLMKSKILETKDENNRIILEQALNLGLAELSGKKVL